MFIGAMEKDAYIGSRRLLVGTSKGLVVFQKEVGQWKVAAIHFEGLPVSMLFVDKRSYTWWAGISHRHWGQKLHRSVDRGNTWEQVPTPQYPQDATLSNGKPAILKQIWTMLQGGNDIADGIWMGTEPGGLFYSTHRGDHFSLVQSLWHHPSREDPHQWFGAGKDHPFIHSVVIDPRSSNTIYVAVSCAGIFKSVDGGKSWTPKNKGLIAAYLPDPHVAVGHDPHRLLLCKGVPDILWQQNHCGIFRSVNGGEKWQLVSDPAGTPHYGFALAIDDQDPLKAWVIPAHSDTKRVPVDLALKVYRTVDGGQSWQALSKGLPQQHCFDIVFRHALDKSATALAFGTTNGNVYISDDEGDTWECIQHHLARVDALVFESD